MENEKSEIIVFVFILIFIFIGTVGFSYGYFRNKALYQDNDTDSTSAKLKLTYEDDNEIIYKDNFVSSETIIKTFYIENAGNEQTYYDLIWKEFDNKVVDDDLLISADCDSMTSDNIMSGTCSDIYEMPLTDSKLKEKVIISPGIKHKYTIKISLRNLDIKQHDEARTFKGVLDIIDYSL